MAKQDETDPAGRRVAGRATPGPGAIPGPGSPEELSSLGGSGLDGSGLDEPELNGADVNGADLEGANLDGNDVESKGFPSQNRNGFPRNGADLNGAANPELDDLDLNDLSADEATEAEAEPVELSGDPELVSVAAASPATTGPVVGKASGATALNRSKKDRPTARHRTAVPGPKRTTPVQFVRESVAELRKVVYPTGPQLANYFVVVLVFVLFVIAVVALLDLGLGWAVFRIFR